MGITILRLCFLGLITGQLVTALNEVDIVDQFLQEYTVNVRLRVVPPVIEGGFFNSLLQNVPVEPSQYTGQCNVTYDPDAYTESRFAMLLPPSTCSAEAPELPPVTDVWQELLLRESFQKEDEIGVNFLLVSWANWFLDDVFFTQKNTNATFQLIEAPLSLGNLYGRTPDRQAALRTFDNGKMKVSRFHGEDYPPLLATIQQDHPNFTMDAPDQLDIITSANPGSLGNFFALGDPRYNLHLGLLYWSTRFLRLHNSLCDMLTHDNPGLTDQQVFETARLIVSHVVIKIIWEDYVGKAIASFRRNAGLQYDPDVLRSLPYPTLQNKVYFEFDQLYRWHALIPDALNLNGGTPLTEAIFNPQLLTQAPLDDITQAFMNTSAGRMAAKNIPSFLWPTTRQAILDARAQRLQGFNAYREAFGLPKFKRFEDFGLNPSLTESLRSLYNNQTDDIEWFVGVMIEAPRAHNTFIPETMLISVATFAVSAILNLDLMKNPVLWTPERLTPAGKAFIQSTSLSSLLGVEQPVPFFTPDRQPSWHTVDSLTTWRWHNMVQFVGMDYVIDPFFNNGTYFHTIFTITLICAMVIIIFAFLAIHMFWMLLGQRTLYPQLSPEKRLITTMHTAFALLLLAQLVPYTYYLLPLLFGPDLLTTLQDTYFVPFTCFVLHGVMYIAEAATRAVIKQNQLLLWHHLLWFVFIFIASLKQSVFAIKLDFILDYMVCWEFALYMSLVAHRLQASRVIQRTLLITAFITYGVSRVVQAVICLTFFIYSRPRMEGQLAVYVIMLLMTAALVVLQTYTLFIYWGIWKETCGNPPKSMQQGHEGMEVDGRIDVQVVRTNSQKPGTKHLRTLQHTLSRRAKSEMVDNHHPGGSHPHHDCS